MKRVHPYTLEHTLDRERIIVIARGVHPERILHTAEALLEGGIHTLEVTLNSEDALRSIRMLSKTFQGQMHIGAGTVLDHDDFLHAVEAGAEFIVTPNVDEEVIHAAVKEDLPIFPGAATPTEIVKSWKAGATAVKLFPNFGCSYIKELQGPFSHIPLIALGGVDAENIADYLRHRVFAVGIGGYLIDLAAIEKGQYQVIKERAQRLIEIVEQYRLSSS
ncbi:bifunctional 4-hydroxy-2-oxoglutarate aldolase/2-dehydro-3-deoxy-phosphogluconate aldolase [Marinicrinis lubricantis]|uniref:Bifunctional 4-hydroxy-2-oxoglutarate aldolase/2-dehydro-3-deoxy-phosphogluconate aldolase n=1 Tax=Marinicrinis lubricantis TaxID=2086470 RepID=A0ABW1IT42_9BACL